MLDNLCLVLIEVLSALAQVVYCARARTSSIEDVKAVEEDGVIRLAVELQVSFLDQISAHTCAPATWSLLSV